VGTILNEMLNASTEAALLWLIGVERGFLGLQISDQFFGPIDRDLIAYCSLYPTIPLNGLVDLYELSRTCARSRFTFKEGLSNDGLPDFQV